MKRFLLLIIGFLLVNACQTKDLQKDMIQFDKAYIPLLYHVYHHNAPAAKQAVFSLAFEWQKFNQNYKGHVQGSLDWTETFRMVDGWLQDAFIAVDANQWDLALVQLDHVRFEWMELRMRHRIPYYLDNIWEFQMAYDLVIEVAKDPYLCLLEWQEFEALVTDLNNLWYPAEKEMPAVAIWGWDQATFEKFEADRRIIAQCLADFTASVECADRENLALDCEDINPALWRIIAHFGELGTGAERFVNIQ